MSPEAISTELEKILASKLFVNANRLSAFLRHIVQQTVAGNTDRLREYQLGRDVFDRKESYDPRTDPVVRVEARQLRFKLESYYKEYGQSDEIVITLPKGGYVPRFVQRESPVVEVEPAEPAKPRFSLVPVAICLIAVVALGWAFLAKKKSVDDTSIAVLPFADRTNDPTSAYFASGLTDELTDALVHVKGVRVVSGSSAVQFTKTGDIRQVGKLGVSHLIEGSVERSGDRIKITAQMQRVSDGLVEWSKTYERKNADLFAVQSEIARAIAANLKAAPGFPARRGHVPSDEVYRLVLEARYEIHQLTAESLARAQADCRRAIELDPNYAPAYALLAWAIYDDVNARGASSRSNEDRKTIEGLLKKAIELDPDRSGPRAQLASVEMQYDWDWAHAEQEFRRAHEDGPTADVETFYAFLLVFQGRFAEAEEHIRLAQTMDPFGTATLSNIGTIRNLEGRFADAREIFEKQARLAPAALAPPLMVNFSYIEEGKPDTALPGILELKKKFPSAALFEAMAHARMGRREHALRLVKPFEDRYPNVAVPMAWFAFVYACLGDEANTVKWLERSLDRREFQALNLAVHPLFASMRGNPQFRALEKKTGLHEGWR